MNKEQIKSLYEKYKTDGLDYKSFSYAVWAYENEINLRKTLRNKKLNVFDFIEKEDKRLFSEVVKFTDNQAIYTNPRYLLIHNLDDSDFYQNCYIDKNLNELKISERDLFYPPYQKVIKTDLEKTFLTKEMLLLASKIKASKKTKQNKAVRFLKENENPIFIAGHILEKIKKFLLAYPEAIIKQSISNIFYFSIKDESTKDEFIFMACNSNDYYATVENNEVVLKLE